MKKYIIACIIGLFIFPFVVSGYTGYTRIPAGIGPHESVEVSIILEAGDVDWLADFDYWKICIFDDTHNGNTNEDDWVADAFCGGANYATTGTSVFTLSGINADILGVSVISWDTFGNYTWTGPDPEWGFFHGLYVWDVLFYLHIPIMEDIITSARTGFASTTGFTVASAVSWSGDNVVKLFIGSGLAVLYNLRYWIMALIIIYLVVFFGYRAFKFFRH